MKVLNQVEPHKALSIDGLSGPFFKKNWATVGKDVLKFRHDIFNGNREVKDINDTMIVLIPKIKEPKDMTYYCLIRL